MIFSRIIRYKFIFWSLFLFAGGGQAIAIPIGTISQVSGDVWLLEKGLASRLVVGDSVDAEHTVVTEEKSLAQVSLEDGTLLNIGAKTRLKLHKFKHEESSDLSFDVLWGEVKYAVKKIIDPSSAFNVKTTTAAMGVRGTEFIVSMPVPSNVRGLQFAPSASLLNIPLLTTTVDMKEGLVALTDLKGVEHMLPEGTITTADAYANVIQIVKGAPVEVMPEPPIELILETLPLKPELDKIKVGSKAAVTTSVNSSSIQSSTITLPRNSSLGGR